MEMHDLKSLVGKEILAFVPFFDQTNIQKLILHGVETGGIWVESQAFLNHFLEKMGVATSPRTLIFFLPWNQVVTIWSALDVPALSEKAFGI